MTPLLIASITFCSFIICSPEGKCMKKEGHFTQSQYSDIVFDNLKVGNTVQADCERLKTDD